jgi:hypothetical protein
VIKKTLSTLPETVDTIEQLARGLDYAHARTASRIAHLVKPFQYPVHRVRRAVIVDFDCTAGANSTFQ